MSNKAHQDSHPARLAEFAARDDYPESLDYPGIHGYVSGLVVRSDEFSVAEALQSILDHPPIWHSDVEKQAINEDLSRLYSTIRNRFFLNQEIILPFSCYLDEGLEGSDLESWACGFIEAYITGEGQAAMDNADEEEFELLLPILVISGLFGDDEKELVELRRDELFLTDAINDLPERLTDLFLCLRRE